MKAQLVTVLMRSGVLDSSGGLGATREAGLLFPKHDALIVFYEGERAAFFDQTSRSDCTVVQDVEVPLEFYSNACNVFSMEEEVSKAALLGPALEGRG